MKILILIILLLVACLLALLTTGCSLTFEADGSRRLSLDGAETVRALDALYAAQIHSDK